MIWAISGGLLFLLFYFLSFFFSFFWGGSGRPQIRQKVNPGGGVPRCLQLWANHLKWGAWVGPEDEGAFNFFFFAFWLVWVTFWVLVENRPWGVGPPPPLSTGRPGWDRDFGGR